jgi:hypothetical protein
MIPDYAKKLADTAATLPLEKQAELCDFAEFLKKTTETKTAKKSGKSSVLKLIGIGKSGVSDISRNHDKYLYDE